MLKSRLASELHAAIKGAMAGQLFISPFSASDTILEQHEEASSSNLEPCLQVYNFSGSALLAHDNLCLIGACD